MFLLDTNVISEARKISSRRADPRVHAWFNAAESSRLFLSVICILELETGALMKERKDKVQGNALRKWLEEQVLPFFDGRIVAIDIEVARRTATLHIPSPRPYRDSLIAATALVHGMTVVTRNTSDFVSTGVELFNPWED